MTWLCLRVHDGTSCLRAAAEHMAVPDRLWQSVLAGESLSSVLPAQDHVPDECMPSLVAVADRAQALRSLRWSLMRLVGTIADCAAEESLAGRISDSCAHILKAVCSPRASHAPHSSVGSAPRATDGEVAAPSVLDVEVPSWDDVQRPASTPGQSPGTTQTSGGKGRVTLTASDIRLAVLAGVEVTSTGEVSAVQSGPAPLRPPVIPTLLLMLGTCLQMSTSMAAVTVSHILSIFSGFSGPGQHTAVDTASDPPEEESFERPGASSAFRPTAVAPSPVARALGLHSAASMRAPHPLLPRAVTAGGAASSSALFSDVRTRESVNLQSLMQPVLDAFATLPAPQAVSLSRRAPTTSSQAKDLTAFVAPLGWRCGSPISEHVKTLFPSMRQALYEKVEKAAAAAEQPPVEAIKSSNLLPMTGDFATFTYLHGGALAGLIHGAHLGSVPTLGGTAFFSLFLVLRQGARLDCIDMAFADTQDRTAPSFVLVSAGQSAFDLSCVGHSVVTNEPHPSTPWAEKHNPSTNTSQRKDSYGISSTYQALTCSSYAHIPLHTAEPVQVICITAVAPIDAGVQLGGAVKGSLKKFSLHGVLDQSSAEQQQNSPGCAAASESTESGDDEKPRLLVDEAWVGAAGPAGSAEPASPAYKKEVTLRRAMLEPLFDLITEFVSPAPFFMASSPHGALHADTDKQLLATVSARRDRALALMQHLDVASAQAAAKQLWRALPSLLSATFSPKEDGNISPTDTVVLGGAAAVHAACAALAALAWHLPLVQESILGDLQDSMVRAGVTLPAGASLEPMAVQGQCLALQAHCRMLTPVLAARRHSHPNQQWPAFGGLCTALASVLERASIAQSSAPSASGLLRLLALPLVQEVSVALAAGATAFLSQYELEQLCSQAGVAAAAASLGTAWHRGCLSLWVTCCEGVSAAGHPVSCVVDAMLQQAMSATVLPLSAKTKHAAMAAFETPDVADAAMDLVKAHTTAAGASSCIAHLTAGLGPAACGTKAVAVIIAALQLVQGALTLHPEGVEVQWRSEEKAVLCKSPALDFMRQALDAEPDVGAGITLATLRATHILRTVADDHAIAGWLGTFLVHDLIRAAAGWDGAAELPKPWFAASGSIQRALSHLLQQLLSGHSANQALATAHISSTLSKADSLTASFLKVFRMVSSLSRRSFISVVPPLAASVMSATLMQQVKEADKQAVEANMPSDTVDVIGAPPSQWARADVTIAQQLAGLQGSGVAGLAAAAIIAHASKAKFSPDFCSQADRFDIEEDGALVKHKSTNNACAALDFGIAAGSGVFHITFELVTLKGNSEPGFTDPSLIVSFGASPLNNDKQRRPVSVNKMQMMVDQKDANCYDGSNDMKDFKQDDFMGVGDTVTIVIDANAATFGFIGADGVTNVAFTDIFSKLAGNSNVDPLLYPAVLLYSSNGATVRLKQVKLVDMPADPQTATATEAQVRVGGATSIASISRQVCTTGSSESAATPGDSAMPMRPLLPPVPVSLQSEGAPVPLAALVCGSSTTVLEAGASPPPVPADDCLAQLPGSSLAVLLNDEAPLAAWRSPTLLLPAVRTTPLPSLAQYFGGTSRFIRWSARTVRPTVVTETQAAATGAGDGPPTTVAVALQALALPADTTVAGMQQGSDSVTVGQIGRVLYPLSGAVDLSASTVDQTLGPYEQLSAVMGVTDAATATAAAPLRDLPLVATFANVPRVITLQYEVLAEPQHAPETPSVVQLPASADAEESAGSMLLALHKEGVLGKLLQLMRHNIGKVFGVDEANLPEALQSLNAPAGDFKYNTPGYAEKHGDSWGGFRATWEEVGASMHRWLRDLGALLEVPGFAASLQQDEDCQALLTAALELHALQTADPAGVFEAFAPPAKRGGEVHWTALAAQALPWVSMGKFLRPANKSTYAADMAAVCSKAGLSSEEGTASKQVQQAGGLTPEGVTIAAGNALSCLQVPARELTACAPLFSSVAQGSPQRAKVPDSAAADPVMALLKPLLGGIHSAPRVSRFLSTLSKPESGKMPTGGTESLASPKEGASSSPLAASEGGTASAIPMAPELQGSAGESSGVADSFESVAAHLVMGGTALRALLVRVGETEGFTPAEESKFMEFTDPLTAAVKEARRKEAEQRKAEEAAKSAEAGGAAEGGAAASSNKKSDERWAKGTGYSWDGQKGLRDFDAAALAAKREGRRQLTTSICMLLADTLSIVDSAAHPSTPPRPVAVAEKALQELCATLDASPLLPVLASYLRSTELDIVKFHQLHAGVYAVLEALASSASLSQLLLPTPHNSTDLSELLASAKGIADDVLGGEETAGSGGAAGKGSDDAPSDDVTKSVMNQLVAAASAAQSAAEALAAKAAAAGHAAGGAAAEAAGEGEIATLDDLRRLYEKSMKKHTLSKIDMNAKGSSPSSFKYWSSVQAESNPPAKRVTATKQMLRALKGSMPLGFESTVLVRYDKRRPYIIHFIIAAPPDTPYDSGLFLFHMYCDPSFPSKSPKVNLQTTGGGSVRFNPNLYSSGKVCLSLLGTWHGGNSREAWTPDSTLLQVFVSIASLIFVSKPYYNEPGVESQIGTEQGKRMERVAENGGYERLRVGTVQWAMVDQLKHPPAGFEEAVKTHFTLKRTHILQTVDTWLKEAKESDTSGHYDKLKKQVDALRVELDKLGPSPADALAPPAEEAAGPSKPAEEAAAEAPPLTPEEEQLKSIIPDFPDGVYKYALAQAKGNMDTAALWLMEKGEQHLTENAAKYS